MATYTFNTNATQEEIISYVVSIENAARASKKPPLPAITNNDYILSLWASVVQSWSGLARKAEIQKIEEKWDTLPKEQQDQIKSIVSVDPKVK